MFFFTKKSNLIGYNFLPVKISCFAECLQAFEDVQKKTKRHRFVEIIWRRQKLEIYQIAKQ